MRQIRVTLLFVVVCVGLFIAVESKAMIGGVSRDDARWHFGAVAQLMVTNEPELSGALNLWEGQWWRIPINSFHHGGLLHLGLNMLCAVYFARSLERRMNPVWHFVFLIFAAMITALAEILPENNAVGFSGVIFAQFGALLVLRRFNPAVAEEIPDRVVTMGLAWLFICIPLTLAEVMPIANLAHFSGFVYGYVVGLATWYVRSTSYPFRLPVALGHLALIPAIYFAMHPFWIGRYHWYEAVQERKLFGNKVDKGRQIMLYQEALSLDPSLAPLWRELALSQATSGHPEIAWSTMLNGLKHNRSFEEGVLLSRRLYRTMNETERSAAKIALRKEFPDDFDAWAERLGVNTSPDNLVPLPIALDLDSPAMSSEKLEFTPSPDDFPDFDHSIPKVDPERPDSAALESSVTL
ncbi:MAG: hypothetical protein CMJ78_16220 [Planctomycetaceae bacterium]|nr:hypothetical protein [Planctomycetaceae bacterium]